MNSKKLKVFIVSTFFLLSAIELKASDECFEGLSRAVFMLNIALYDFVIESIA